MTFLLFTGCKPSGNPERSLLSAKKLSKSLNLYLPDDLQAVLWAESPMFFNPTNMDVDSKGRIWITEAVNYRNFNNDSTKFLHHSGGDRVMILEDTNGDGVADTSKVFVEDSSLVSPLGIAVIGNKVIVSCSPNLIVYTDDDGDDKPDRKEILLTGFGGKDHDHSLHAVVAGADGNLYFITGNAGPHIVTDKTGWTLRSGSLYTGGTPYNLQNQGNMKSDDGKVWVGGLALSMRPDGSGLRVLGHNFRNSYELTSDSYGDLWQNDNDDELAACRTAWLMEGGNAGYFSTDGTRAWQADQRPDQDIFTAHWHQEDPGVMPIGDRSGAGAPTGIVVNEGDGLGNDYRGVLLSADAGRNIVFGYLPERDRSGFKPAQRTNLVSSLSGDTSLYVWNDSVSNSKNERWFRPSDVAIGTDGAIYVADWYDPVVGGHQMQDPKGYGRIYRISPKNKTLHTPKIDLSTVQGQVDALKSPAINVRHLGFAKLKEQGEHVLHAVSALLKDENPYVRARAIWLLPQLGAGGIAATEQLLRSTDEHVRLVAFRALRASSPDILHYATQLQSDHSAMVRREVAIAVRDLPFEKTKPLLLELIRQFDGEDGWYLEAVSASLAGHEEDIYPQLKSKLTSGEPPALWNNKMSAFAWRLHPLAALPDLLARATDTGLDAKSRRSAITAIGFINNAKAAEDMLVLSSSKLTDVREQASYWLSFRHGNDWFSYLNWKKINFNTAYEQRLATMKAKRLAVLDRQISLEARKGRLEDMARDSIGGQLLIGLAAENKFPKELVPFMETSIFNNPDITVRMQAGDYFRQPGGTTQYSVTGIAAMAGDDKKGLAVFTSYCASCHKIGQTGNNTGPELTSIGKKFDKAALLDAIINPSGAIMAGYEPWLVNTRDGGSFYGFLVSENKQTIIIKDVTGKLSTIPIDKISSRQKQDKSMMPEPGLRGLTGQQLADVVSYLQHGSR